MAQPVRVKLKIGGVRQVLKSSGVQGEVNRHTGRMAAAAGVGFEAIEKPHRYTSRGFVQTKVSDRRGRVRQARDHVLQRVLGSQT